MGTKERTNGSTLLLVAAALAVTAPLCDVNSARAESCPGDLNGNGQVTIDEILKAVNAALDGCPVAPTPTPQPACAERFCDNGDGTITDTQTGLMWEKKVGLDGIPGGLHDVDNAYPWAGHCSATYPLQYCQPTAEAAAACAADADGDTTGCGECAGTQGTCVSSRGTTDFTTIWEWITQLNGGGGFAGHTDWRVPTLPELVAINDGSNYALPPFGNGTFHQSSCSAGCSDLEDVLCSCMKGNLYWSATTFETTEAWLIIPGGYAGSATSHIGLVLDTYVRAVRGGS